MTSTQILAPIRFFLKSYWQNKGPMTRMCYINLLDYLDTIEEHIIALQKENMELKEKLNHSISIESAEEWIQHRLMIDIPELAKRLS